jgi:hypothetical protein
VSQEELSNWLSLFHQCIFEMKENKVFIKTLKMKILKDFFNVFIKILIKTYFFENIKKKNLNNTFQKHQHQTNH